VVAAVARLLRRSYVISEHNGWLSGELLTLGKNRLVARFAERAQLLDARLADQVVVVSDVVGEHFARAGIPPDKLLVVGNGTDTDRLRPVDRAASLARWGLEAERHHLGFLGTLAAWQGVAQAVEALPLLIERDPTILFVVGGDGPEREPLVRLARRLGVEDHVIFTGHVPIPDANSLLNCFDVAIAPKTAEIAALGMSPLKLRDYAAAGRPVAAPDVPGIEVVTVGR
jgi:glycosyltransferase involved in cell wall biosynthesis